MQKSELMEKLVAMLQEVSPSVDVAAERAGEDLEALGYDSLDQSNFLLMIDEQLEVNIEDADASQLKTLNDYVEFLSKRLD